MQKKLKTSGKAVEQLRLIDTPSGYLVYALVRKRVKNLNLHLERSGKIVLSVPLRCDAGYADDVVRKHAQWICRKQAQQAARRPVTPLLDQEECGAVLREALDSVYPLVEPLGVDYPQLKLRRMKSQWGNCHWAQGYITLNTALARCPEHLRRYVALHELVHFLHHDHGAGFYARMDSLMPQWQEFRRELKGYISILEE